LTLCLPSFLDCSSDCSFTAVKAGSFNTHLKCHLVWITKYRKLILRGEIGKRVRELIHQTCATLDVFILSGHIAADHIHLLLSAPNLSLSDLVQRLKGRTSRLLMNEYTELKKAYWGRHLWVRDYFVASSSTSWKTLSSSTSSRKVKTFRQTRGVTLVWVIEAFFRRLSVTF